MAETRGFEPLDDITIIDYLVGSYFKPNSVMFPKKMEHRADLETASIVWKTITLTFVLSVLKIVSSSTPNTI